MHWSWQRPDIPKRYQSWLTVNRWWLQTTALGITALVITAAFKRNNWAPWTGFQGKDLWAWLQLLGVPLTLAILGYLLQQQEKKRSREEAKDEILTAYIDRVSLLLIDKNLLGIASKIYPIDDDDEDELFPEHEKPVDIPDLTLAEKELFVSSIDVIRARTLAILRQFENDEVRKASVLRFLIETKIIQKAKLCLKGADLSGIELLQDEADLNGINLTYANLSGVSFPAGFISNANLANANLRKAYLPGVAFKGTELTWADLSDACLLSTYFKNAELQFALLRRANLSQAFLTNAWLMKADLRGADLSQALLNDADLSGTDLRETSLDQTRLDNIKFDEHTKWPENNEVAKAINLPKQLQQKLGVKGLLMKVDPAVEEMYRQIPF
ncbi:pentapeptide repeat-containing protein [Leptothoe sp. EHU-05/26/07-4]